MIVSKTVSNGAFLTSDWMNTFNLIGNGDVITTTGIMGTYDFTGNGDQLWDTRVGIDKIGLVGDNDIAFTNGGSNTDSVTGASDLIWSAGVAVDKVTINGSGNWFVADGGTKTVTITGDGNTAYFLAAANINVQSGSYSTYGSDNNTIVVTGGSASVNFGYGQNSTFYALGGGDYQAFGGGYEDTFVGGGGQNFFSTSGADATLVGGHEATNNLYANGPDSVVVGGGFKDWLMAGQGGFEFGGIGNETYYLGNDVEAISGGGKDTFVVDPYDSPSFVGQVGDPTSIMTIVGFDPAKGAVLDLSELQGAVQDPTQGFLSSYLRVDKAGNLHARYTDYNGVKQDVEIDGVAGALRGSGGIAGALDEDGKAGDGWLKLGTPGEYKG